MLEYITAVMGVDNISNTIVKEDYYGKSKKLLDIEKQIGVTRQKYLGRGIDSGFYDDKDINKIGIMIADMFGFNYVDFNLANNVMPNAYTYPIGRGVISGFSTSPQNMRKTKEGLKSKNAMKDLSLYIRVTTGLFYNEEYSDSEILAIILHEIGHNFQGKNAVLANYDLFMAMSCMIAMISSGGATAPIYLTSDPYVRANINKTAKNSPALSSIVKTFSGISGMISIVNANFDFLLALISPIFKYAYNVIMNIGSHLKTGNVIGILTKPLNKSAEYVSDDFANELGYGPELATALTKMELTAKNNTLLGKAVNTSENPIVKFYNNYMDTCLIVASVILVPLQDHPSTGKRIKAMTDKLEDELKNSDLSPQLKKDIKAQIKQMNELGDMMQNIDGSTAMKNFIKFQMGRKKDPISSLVLKQNNYIAKENANIDDLMDYM